MKIKTTEDIVEQWKDEGEVPSEFIMGIKWIPLEEMKERVQELKEKFPDKHNIIKNFLYEIRQMEEEE